MARVSIAVFDALPVAADWDAADERPDPTVRTRVVFADGRVMLPMRVHDLPAGAAVRWQDSRTGHVVYVWSGSLRVGVEELATGSVVVVEHGAGVTVAGGAAGGTILVFNPAQAGRRAGGNVHVLPAAAAPRKHEMAGSKDFGAAMYADSQCPTCELWLHENNYRTENYLVAPHRHSEDEIIVVTAGQIVLGQRHYGPGTAIFIARDTLYSFRTGAGGLSYINFRASHPSYLPAGATAAIDELSYYPEILAPPYHSPRLREETP